jgi:arylformamidase
VAWDLTSLDGYRIVDLSEHLIPGQGDRKLILKPWRWPADNSLMHDIETMSHVGTHIEMPSHWIEGGKDSSAMPVETFFGEGVVLHLHFDSSEAPITVQVLKSACRTGFRRGDIVFLTSSFPADGAPPKLTDEAAAWLVDQGVKLFGFDSSVKINGANTHDIFLRKDVPLAERLHNLKDLKQERVFLIALPLRIQGLESSCVRAIAVEKA